MYFHTPVTHALASKTYNFLKEHEVEDYDYAHTACMQIAYYQYGGVKDSSKLPDKIRSMPLIIKAIEEIGTEIDPRILSKLLWTSYQNFTDTVKKAKEEQLDQIYNQVLFETEILLGKIVDQAELMEKKEHDICSHLWPE